MKIAVLVKPNNGCSWYRCILPLKYMEIDSNTEIKLFYPKGFPQQYLNSTSDLITNLDSFGPDIIFFNNNIQDCNVEFYLKYKNQGCKIVIDVDDYWEISPTHPVYQYWYKDKVNETIIETLKIADIVFAVNEQLRTKVLQYNKNCLVLPNAVPFGEPYYTQSLPKPNLQYRKMNFLYSGGSSHYNDILILKNKFDRIGSDQILQRSCVFTLAGFNPLPNTHCNWDKMASVFKRTNSYEILPTKPLQEHLTFLDSADVCLIPLQDSQFNRCKSFLKIIEASTRELPCIVSDVLPYSELKDFPGLFWNNWLENIKMCKNSHTFVQDQGKLLAEKMKEKFDIRIWSRMRKNIFNHLMN